MRVQTWRLSAVFTVLLSTQNVYTLLYAVHMPDVSIIPEFIQLLDDDIVSLTALTLIVNPKCKEDYSYYVSISQLTLSLYLMAQCQLKRRRSVTELARSLEFVKVAYRRHPMRSLDRLVLKTIAHKSLSFIGTCVRI